MFQISWCDRDMTRDQWGKLRAILKKTGDWQRDVVAGQGGWLQERADLLVELAECTDENGVTGIVEGGRDCDCVQFCWPSKERNLTLVKYVRDRDNCYSWADGPSYYSLCHPEDLPESYSRDLALEAYEDGHSHSVSSVRYDEEGSYYV